VALALLLADSPALPLHEAGKYVAGAYIVFVVLLVVYVALMATKVARIERELKDVTDYAEKAKGRPGIPGREAEEMPAEDKGGPVLRDDQAAPGRGSEGSSISDSLTPHGSGGGGA
jgi:hypothetical protein